MDDPPSPKCGYGGLTTIAGHSQRRRRGPRAFSNWKEKTMTQDVHQQLMDDPQLMELAGKLFIAKEFHYITNFAFTASGTLLATLQIDSDADFQHIFTQGTRDSNAVTVEVTEGGAGGLAWQSSPVNIDNFMGTAQNPFPAGLIPQLLPKKRVYKISLVNTSGGANNVQIDFWGYKLYPAEMAAQLGAEPSQNQ
jgi:hypothetical protein